MAILTYLLLLIFFNDSGRTYIQVDIVIFTWYDFTSYSLLPPSLNKDNVHTLVNGEFPFFDIKISWSPEVGLNYLSFSNKGLQLKFSSKLNIYTYCTLRAIVLGVLNCLLKTTSRKLNFYPKRVDSVYSNHVKSLHEAGLAPSIFQRMGSVWKS